MALLKYFKKSVPSASLPSAKDTGIGEFATNQANAAVSKVLKKAASTQPILSRKRKNTVFSPQQRAVIGEYAAQHGNSAEV